MIRTLLSLLIVCMFALAGSVILAQADSETPLQEVAPSAQSGSSTGDPMYQDAPAQQEGMAPQPSTAAGAETHESLPATASPLPLAFAIGVLALGAVSALRAYRLRSPH
ncbi:MAG TPA: hypothetical protein VGV60_18025 [Candidatus Polarisedimenticolia bacterium]|jgi:hypothetical protein|nr:hypothetical protein [Candidatus Polarisedimenticolia bacterium]